MCISAENILGSGIRNKYYSVEENKILWAKWGNDRQTFIYCFSPMVKTKRIFVRLFFSFATFYLISSVNWNSLPWVSGTNSNRRWRSCCKWVKVTLNWWMFISHFLKVTLGTWKCKDTKHYWFRKLRTEQFTKHLMRDCIE